MRRGVRGADLVGGVDADPARSGEHDERDRDGGERLGFSVTVGMFRIRRFRSVAKPGPDQKRGRHVEQRLDAVGDEGVGGAEHASGEFERGKPEAESNTAEHEPRAFVGAFPRGGVGIGTCGGGLDRCAHNRNEKGPPRGRRAFSGKRPHQAQVGRIQNRSVMRRNNFFGP